MDNVDLCAALHDHFGFSDFRPGQREAVEYALLRRDALVVMPTGSGKSLCYQLPALVLDGLTLVISPLIALMKDQVDTLTAANKRATFINSALAPEEVNRRLAGLARGDFKIVYVAPERLRNSNFIRALGNAPISLLAVDEAHCISQWGHDFRPDYMHLREFIAQAGKPPVLALTATATPEVQDDIVKQLGLPHAERVVTGFNRPNLSLNVRYTPGDPEKMRDLKSLLTFKDHHGIIYTGTRRDAEAVAEYVNEALHIRAEYYHAGVEDAKRTRVQDGFMADEIPVIVATNAFGMGVDKPDIRFVIHYSLPATVEAYYQEVGRAGRDGKPARAVLLYSPQDRALQEWFIENDAPKSTEVERLYRLLPRGLHTVSAIDLQRQTGLMDTKLKVALMQLETAGALQRMGDEGGSMLLQVNSLARLDLSKSTAEVELFRQVKRRKLDRMIEYAETNSCRRRFILDYFGDHGPADAPDCCDNHVAKAPPPPAAELDSVPLTILDCVRSISGRVGRMAIGKILTGSRAKEILRFQRNAFYGTLAHVKRQDLDACVDRLIEKGYIKVVGGKFPVAELSPLGTAALTTRAAIPVSAPQANRSSAVAHTRKSQSAVEYTLELFDQGLVPSEIARQSGVKRDAVYEHLARLIAQGQVALDRVIAPELQAQIRAAMKKAHSGRLSAVKAHLPERISYGEVRCVVAAQEYEQNGPVNADTTPEVKTGKPGSGADIDKQEAQVDELIRALSDPNANVRRQAAAALGKLKAASSVDGLLAALLDAKPQVRQYAIKALGEIGNPRSVPQLTRIHQDPNEKPFNRVSAGRALKQISLEEQSKGHGESAASTSVQAAQDHPNPSSRA